MLAFEELDLCRELTSDTRMAYALQLGHAIRIYWPHRKTSQV